jgi:voltage-gated potassium channel
MKYYTFGFKTFILGRYGSLLIALILLMIMQPTVDAQFGKYFLEAIFVVILFTGLRALGIKKSLFGFEVLLLLVSLVLNVTGMVAGNEVLFFVGIACRTLFMILVALTILFDLFQGRKVSGDTLAGAVCVYLMLAVIWGHIFLLIEYMAPGSFSFTQGQDRMHLWLSREFFPFFYFSLVTITTVGYGDMAPVSTEAQTFATLEAIIGQVYLTILVARLVGMYLVHQQVDNTNSGEEAEKKE